MALQFPFVDVPHIDIIHVIRYHITKITYLKIKMLRAIFANIIPYHDGKVPYLNITIQYPDPLDDLEYEVSCQTVHPMTVDLSMGSMYVTIVVFVSFFFLTLLLGTLISGIIPGSMYHLFFMIIRPSITGECDNLI